VLTLVVSLTLLGVGAPEEIDQNRIDFFEKKIRPVLVEHCDSCHSVRSERIRGGLRLDDRAAVLQGGDGGKVLVPGDAAASRLIEALRYTNRDLAMPPLGKLPDAVIADFVRWVEMGAPDPRDVPAEVDAPKATPFDFSRARKFWAFQPPRASDAPTVKNSAWARSPLDHFVLARLEENGLGPAPVADRRTLIRRATFDLLGLPPTPEEIDNFLADRSADAFSRVVDRLLQSPRYGERWGRHWLDVARYADSNGLDENLCHANAFRYRDYVIEAFNADKPYADFIVEQIAGDLIPDESNPETTAARQIATGFLVMGAKMLADDDPQKKKFDIVDEQIDTIGRGFMGLSIGCARCHDHKFDPIPTLDYYSLAGIFQSTKTMSSLNVVARWFERPVTLASVEEERRPILARMNAKKKQLERITNEANATLLESERKKSARYLLAALELRQPRDTVLLEAENFRRGDVRRITTGYGEGIGVIANSAAGFVEYPIRLKTGGEYELSLRYAAQSPRPLKLLVDGDELADGIAEKTTGGWYPQHQKWSSQGVFQLRAGPQVLRLERSEVFPHVDKIRLRLTALPELDVATPVPEGPEAAGVAARHGVRGSFLRAWVEYLDRASEDSDSVFTALLTLEAETPRPGAFAELATALATSYQKSFDRVLATAPDPSTASKTSPGDLPGFFQVFRDEQGPFATPDGIEDDYTEEVAAARKTLQDEVVALETQLPPEPAAMGVTENKIQNLQVHLRGNYLTPGDEAPRRLPRAFFPETPPLLGDQQSGRLELGRWLASVEHPLTSRVLVNRLWRWHFGTGLVRTTDNFGTTGEAPSHPQLLDWLALRFTAKGWSIKELHRTILTSATYRMSTLFNERAYEVDPDNRLLWRWSRRRLEAEALRDALLAISGQLDLAMGGSLLKVKNFAYVTSVGTSITDEYENRRRSVYVPVVRSALYDLFQAFDFADPSTLSGDRVTTTVAPQALFFMNSEFVREQARLTAERLRQGSTDRERLVTLYRWAFSRRPSEKDEEQALGFLAAYREKARVQSREDGEGNEAREENAWQALCRALFASNEFVYVE
jgi:hypothetical protein